MTFEYTNRRGDRYYVFQGSTKTGKPKFYASKKSKSESGFVVSELPDDFEIFENPADSTVTVRRRKLSQILPEERDLVERLALELSTYSYVPTIVDGDSIVVYAPDCDPAQSAATMTKIFGFAPGETEEWTRRHTRYSAEFRFTLSDATRRTFSAERYCYRGSIDTWMKIGRKKTLEPLARELLLHLGRDTFYDLI